MTKKEQAFALFSEGKTTSSPEVKDFKLKGGTSFNYYLEWQRNKGGQLHLHCHPLGRLKGKTGLGHLYSFFRFTFLGLKSGMLPSSQRSPGLRIQ